nr:hypothetical protein [Candidatus Woesearchaeota archaeon]
MKTNIEYLESKLRPIELSKLATKFLEENGYSIFGRPIQEHKRLYCQNRFENFMVRGAYSKSGESGRLRSKRSYQ